VIDEILGMIEILFTDSIIKLKKSCPNGRHCRLVEYYEEQVLFIIIIVDFSLDNFIIKLIKENKKVYSLLIRMRVV
jgi:hypothetical protein